MSQFIYPVGDREFSPPAEIVAGMQFGNYKSRRQGSDTLFYPEPAPRPANASFWDWLDGEMAK